MQDLIDVEMAFGANCVNSLPVVLIEGSGIYVKDIEGKLYLDMMSGLGVAGFGHSHKVLLQALFNQANRITAVSRLYHSETLPILLQRVCQLTGFNKALPMNSGAEAVETAIKAARRYAYKYKGIAENQAEIIVCRGNFHGRTTTLVGLSSDPRYQFQFGPFTPGFRLIPYDDPEMLSRAITANTAAFLVEPIQGKSGIIMPQLGYLKKCAKICQEQGVLFLCDEIQTGMGRSGRFFAYEHEEVQPDGVMLGKSLGGGILPISLFLAKQELMDVFTPGDHGSTFGGNPLAAAVALAALNLLIEENLIKNAEIMGSYFLEQLHSIHSPLIKAIRGCGLLLGIELDNSLISAQSVCRQLMKAGLLTSHTGNVIRLLPPLIINQAQIDQVITILHTVFC